MHTLAEGTQQGSLYVQLPLLYPPLYWLRPKGTMSFSLITLNNVVFHFLVQSLALNKAM